MLQSLFQYDFITNAFVSMLFLSIVAGVVGTYVVVRRMVFVAGGITHASFGGIGIAYYCGFSPICGALIFAIFSALGLEYLNSKARIRQDSAIAMLWSLGMSVGLIFMFLTPGYAPNLMGFLFGDVLTVSDFDVFCVGLMAFVVVGGACVFYRPLLYVSFSPAFAKIIGWRVSLINALMSIVVAISIVVSIKAVGIILVLSLFTIPQSIANFFIRKLNHLMILSTSISVVGSACGLILSFVFDLPAGAVITALLTISLLIVRIILAILKR